MADLVCPEGGCLKASGSFFEPVQRAYQTLCVSGRGICVYAHHRRTQTETDKGSRWCAVGAATATDCLGDGNGGNGGDEESLPEFVALDAGQACRSSTFTSWEPWVQAWCLSRTSRTPRPSRRSTVAQARIRRCEPATARLSLSSASFIRPRRQPPIRRAVRLSTLRGSRSLRPVTWRARPRRRRPRQSPSPDHGTRCLG